MLKKMLMFVLLAVLVLAGCENPSNDSGGGDDLVSEPEAQAADDNAATGVYKGVLADDDLTGTYKVEISDTLVDGNLRAAGDVYQATLTIEVNDSSQTQSGTATEQNDGSFIVDFSATVGGVAIELDMEVSSTGDIDDISVTADGWTVQTEAVKETSTTLVEAWEGTFSGDASGVWNFISYGGTVSGVFSGEEAGWGSFYGTLTDTSVSVSGDATATGTINGTSGSGTWSSYWDSTGTWSGSRTR